MARSTIEFLPKLLEAECESAFNVFIAYEDLEAGQHARDICDPLFERLGADCKCISQMWRFDVLRTPECCALAAKEAASGDLIVISSHGVGELPGEVKAWIEFWLRDKGELMALVALFDRPHPGSGPDWAIQDYLAGVAERGQISFFAEPDVWPDQEPRQTGVALEPSLYGPPEAWRPPEAVTLPDPNMGHWGLNE
jgi:hypothetical protein